MAIKDYSTYIPTGGVDWAKLTNDIVGKVNDIGTSRQAEKDALDLMMTDANALMNKEELYSSQKLQEFVLAGADSGRKQIAQWNADLKNGILSPKDYKNRMNNIKDGWATLANSAKTYDKANQEFIDRQVVDPKLGFSTGSGLEQYQAEIFAEVGELGDKRVFFDPITGKPYTAKITPEGIDPNTMTPTFRYAAPNNFFDNNIDVNAIITSGTKDLASYKVENGRETISDPLKNPATANAVVLLKNGILSNPRYIAQVLDRYSGVDYDYYRTDAEKDNKVLSMLDTKIEARKLSGAAAYTDEEINKLKNDLGEQLILVRADNTGVYQPVISDKQREIADKYVLDQIKSRIEYEKTLDEPNYGGGGGGGGGGGNKKDNNEIDPYLYEIHDAFMKGGTVALNKLAGQNLFTTVKGKKGYALIPDDPKDEPTVFFTNVEDMFKQFGYSSKANEFRTNMRAITNQKNPTVQTATNAEWLKAGWTQDQINKAVQSGQIKVK
jgi:hypothetical protein